MVKKPGLVFLSAGLLFINAAGFFLRYSELDTYFILIGFRFHFSIVISLLIILNYFDLKSVKARFIHPVKQKFIPVVIAALFPLLFIPLDIFILKEFNTFQKEYFYELGLSSIFDFPIYLIWNIPQLFLFYIFIDTVIPSEKYRLIKTSFIILLLFIYELIPLNGQIDFNQIDYSSISSFFLLVILTGLISTRIKNIYIFSLIIFLILWGTVLSFGSSSETLVNILLASQYESWDGFIRINKKFEFTEYLQPAYLFFLLIFCFFYLKKNKNRPAS